NLSVTASAGTIQCHNGSTTLTAIASGANGTVQYSLNGGPFQASNTFTVNAAGSPYVVTARQANDTTCTATSPSVTVTDPLAVSATEIHTAISCNGGSSTVTISASGGTAPYNGIGDFSRTAGTYTFTVTDSHGCTATVSATITQPTVLVASESHTSPNC